MNHGLASLVTINHYGLVRPFSLRTQIERLITVTPVDSWRDLLFIWKGLICSFLFEISCFYYQLKNFRIIILYFKGEGAVLDIYREW